MRSNAISSPRSLARLKLALALIVTVVICLTMLPLHALSASAAPSGSATKTGDVLAISAPGSPFESIKTTPGGWGTFQVHHATYGDMVWAPTSGAAGSGASLSVRANNTIPTTNYSTPAAGIRAALISMRPAATTDSANLRDQSLDRVGGSGTLADPWYIEFGRQNATYVLTQRLSYTAGQAAVRIDTTVKNKSATAFSNPKGHLTAGLDCVFSGSDVGVTRFPGTGSSANNLAQCAATADTGAPAMTFVAMQDARTVMGGNGLLTIGEYGYANRGLIGSMDKVNASQVLGGADPANKQCVVVYASAFTSSGARCNTLVDNGFAYSWDMSSLEAGESQTRSFYATYDKNLAFADLQLDVTADSDTINVGEAVTYTVEVTNDGADAAKNITALFPLPAGMQFVSSSAGYDSQSGEWSVGDLANGAKATLTVTAKATAGGTTRASIAAAAADSIDPTPCAVGSQAGNCGAAATVEVVRAVTAGTSTITAAPASVPADGIATSQVSVTLRDGVGEVMTEANEHTVTLESTLGDLSEVTPVGDGVYAATLTSTQVGSATVQGSVDGEPITGVATVEFTELPPAPNASSFSVSEGPRVADGTDSHTLRVTLKNSVGGSAGIAPDELSATSAPTEGVEIGAFTADPDVPGDYTAPVTSTRSGTFGLQVAMGGSAVPAGANHEAVFVAGAPTGSGPNASGFTVSSGPQTADGTQAHHAYVQLRDGQGNAVTDAAAAITATVESGEAVQVTGFVESGATGMYTADITSTTAGTKTLRVTVDGALDLGAQDVEFVAGAVDASSSRIVVSEGTRTAGVESHTATVTVVDAQGHSVEGVDVHFTSDATVAAPIMTTDSDGVASTTVSSDRAGDFSVWAYVGDAADTGVADSPRTVTFVAGAPSIEDGHSRLTVTAEMRTADGEDGHTITVTVVDGFGNPIEGAEVTLSPDASVTLAEGVLVTGGDGTATTTATSTTAGTFQIGGTLGGEALAPITVQFVSDDPSAVTSFWSIAPESSQPVASAFAATVTVLDPHGNPVEGQEVVFDLPAGVTPVDAGPFTTDETGHTTAYLTSTTAGSYEITASVEDARIGAAKTIQFTAGAAELTVDGNTSLSATTDPVLANDRDTHTITAVVQDGFGNPIPDTEVSFVIPSELHAPATEATTGADGIATLQVSSATPGAHEVTATIGGAPIQNGSPVTVVFTAGATDAAQSTLAVSPEGPIATGDPVTATVTVLGESGLPVQGAVTVTLDDPSGNATFLEPATGVAGPDGEFVTTFTSTSPDAVRVHATVDDRTVGTGDGTEVAFRAGAASIVTSSIEVESPVLVGEASVATVRLVDRNGNPVEVPAAVEIFASDAATVSPVQSQGGGVYSATVTSTTAGERAVTFSIDGNTAEQRSTVRFVAQPAAPVLHPSAGHEIRGIVEPGMEVSVTDENDEPIPGQMSLDENGEFVFTPSVVLSDGAVIRVVATNSDGYSSAPAAVTVDGQAPGVPVVQPSDGSTIVVTGVEDGSAPVVTDPGTGELVPGEWTDNGEGTWTFVPDPELADETTVVVTVVDPAGNPSAGVESVVDGRAPGVPVVQPSDGSTVIGSAEAGSTINVTDGEGRTLCTVVVPQDGAFRCTLTPAQDDGSILSVVVVDPAGNTSEDVRVMVDATAPTAPVVHPTDGGHLEVTGIAPGTTPTVIDPGTGKQIPGEWTDNGDGTWSFVPDSPLAAGSTVVIVVTDAAGNTVEVELVVGLPFATVAHQQVAQGGTLVVDGGNFQPGERVSAVLHSDPLEMGTATVEADGLVRFSVKIPADFELGAHTVTLTAERSGEVSAPVTVVRATTPSAGGGLLETTGTAAPVTLVVIAMLAVCGGLLLVVRRRRSAADRSARA